MRLGHCTWEAWGACQGEGACSPAATESRACGNCSTQQRTCLGSCQWGAWGTCTGEGACTPLATQSCGNCGTQSCSNTCQWQACGGEGACSPLATQSCGNCGTQSCSSTCQWQACGGEGARRVLATLDKDFDELFGTCARQATAERARGASRSGS